MHKEVGTMRLKIPFLFFSPKTKDVRRRARGIKTEKHLCWFENFALSFCTYLHTYFRSFDSTTVGSIYVQSKICIRHFAPIPFLCANGHHDMITHQNPPICLVGTYIHTYTYPIYVSTVARAIAPDSRLHAYPELWARGSLLLYPAWPTRPPLLLLPPPWPHDDALFPLHWWWCCCYYRRQTQSHHQNSSHQISSVPRLPGSRPGSHQAAFRSSGPALAWNYL